MICWCLSFTGGGPGSIATPWTTQYHTKKKVYTDASILYSINGTVERQVLKLLGYYAVVAFAVPLRGDAAPPPPGRPPGASPQLSPTVLLVYRHKFACRALPHCIRERWTRIKVA
jgi:hypothetical protein